MTRISESRQNGQRTSEGQADLRNLESTLLEAENDCATKEAFLRDVSNKWTLLSGETTHKNDRHPDRQSILDRLTDSQTENKRQEPTNANQIDFHRLTNCTQTNKQADRQIVRQADK